MFISDTKLYKEITMLNQRTAGILCPIFSLPSEEGIGTLGIKAHEFVDFLKASKQKYWQILPIGLTSYGDSPYQSFSSYAGNPYFIDLSILKQKNYLKDLDFDWGNPEYIEYEVLWNNKYTILKTAFKASNFGNKELQKAFQKYTWLEDFATFMALKNHFKNCSRLDWTEARTKKTLSDSLKSKIQDEILFQSFLQVEFYEQWTALKKHANKQGISIIGDVPIFVAGDSTDVWADPEYFLLDDEGYPLVVAGVPPDYFSETGQLWGNPLYDWTKLKKDGFSWWINRIKEALTLFDVVRVDHFRGFEAYWAVPATDDTALNGEWIKAPGKAFFKAVKKEIGEVAIIAEDLGVITDEVKALIKETQFPGMAILQFAFDSNMENPYKPHNLPVHKIVYTGTHDNNTTVGWFKDPQNKEAVDNAITYLELDEDISPEDFTLNFIEVAYKSKANIAIIPIQDLLLKDLEARINTPSTLGMNWKWRMLEIPSEEKANYLKTLIKESSRVL